MATETTTRADVMENAIREIRMNAVSLLGGALDHFDRRDFATAVRMTCDAALRTAAAAAAPTGATCVHCGEPTGHEGSVCYGCAHVGVPELGGEGG